MHVVTSFDRAKLLASPKWGPHSTGLTRASLVNRALGSVHMDYEIVELAPGGEIQLVMHAFEKGIYMLAGTLELERDGKAMRLGKADYALIETATEHAYRNTGSEPARWVELSAPQPKLPGDEMPDTFFLGKSRWQGPVAAPNYSDPRVRGVGHDDGTMAPHRKVHGDLHGFSQKMLIDAPAGSVHFDMFLIEFVDGGLCNHHDHPFEEAYFVLEGTVDIRFGGKDYKLKPGDFGWNGVGTRHAFFPRSGNLVKWLEVMVPQPPVRDGVRFHARWERFRDALAKR